MSAVQRYARHTPGYEARVDAAGALLRQAATDYAGRIVQASSLGAEDMVVTDLIARQSLAIPLATLDTGALHERTRELMARMGRHYRLPLEVWGPPQDAVLHFLREHGADAMRRSIGLRKACCALRKVEPLTRLLQERDAWITGLRREQSPTRHAVSEIDRDADGRRKFNPLAAWSWHDVWHYLGEHEVPYNALHDQFFPSIGCAPCTRAVAAGEDPRAGRWWWEQETARECGLHPTPPLAAIAP